MKTVIIMAVFSIFALNAMYLSSPSKRKHLNKKDSIEIYRNTSEAKEGTFKLKYNYPANINLEPEKYTWKGIDFRDSSQTEDYMLSVLNYFLSEHPTQIGKEQKWFLDNSWFHAPGLAKKGDNSGRESIHGLTKEISVPAKTLHTNQVDMKGTWAVGFYNNVGAVTIGKAWKDSKNTIKNGIKFDENTVNVKLLFTRANVKEVPYLKNTLSWKANTSPTGEIAKRNTQTPLNLLQVDIAVKYKRSDTGWVFGTFVYHHDYNSSKTINSKSDIWKHLVPIGLMWDFSKDSAIITQSYGKVFRSDKDIVTINKKWDLLSPKSVGFNGIVDNPTSNCMSCHATLKNPLNNYDFSLQLAYGFNNFKNQ